MKRRVAWVAAAVALAACSGDDGATPTSVTGPSFACLMASGRAQLNQGTPVADARTRIEAILDDVGNPVSENERFYWKEHLRRLRGVPGDEPIGERLNGIPCNL